MNDELPFEALYASKMRIHDDTRSAILHNTIRFAPPLLRENAELLARYVYIFIKMLMRWHCQRHQKHSAISIASPFRASLAINSETHVLEPSFA